MSSFVCAPTGANEGYCSGLAEREELLGSAIASDDSRSPVEFGFDAGDVGRRGRRGLATSGRYLGSRPLGFALPQHSHGLASSQKQIHANGVRPRARHRAERDGRSKDFPSDRAGQVTWALLCFG